MVEEVDEPRLDGFCCRPGYLLGDDARGEGLERVDFLGEAGGGKDPAVVGCDQGFDAGFNYVKGGQSLP